MAGGGVKPGFTYGATDEFGCSAVENRVHVHDLHATILHLMGLDHEKLTYRYSGRDFRLTDVHGNVVREIIAYSEYEQTMAIFGEAGSLDRQAENERAAKKYEEAIPLFIRLMEKYPDTEVEVGALSNLGICYEFLRRWKEAVQSYDKVIALFQEDKASQEAYKFAKGHRDWIVTSRL